jgi:hypothetical protein
MLTLQFAVTGAVGAVIEVTADTLRVPGPVVVVDWQVTRMLPSGCTFIAE